LNNGGSIQTILGALPSSFSYPHTIRLEDITGDEIPELMYVYSSGFSKFYIFTCSGGKYKIFEGKAESILIDFYGVFDMNLNNSPELVVVTRSCSGGGCWRYYVLEWNGNTYVDLSPDAFVDDVLEEKIVDINNDGFLEIVARTAPVPFYVSQPWREELHIFSWDGNAFVPQIARGYQPEYRFHAIQDADLETSLGDYDTALYLYNQVISNGNLDWWSRERQKFEQSKLNSLWEHTPTPSVGPLEDKTEYPRLAAYAYYRIMLLQLVQDHESDANTTYNILQKEFSSDPYARPYVEMASAFWEAYLSTHKMYDGCAATIQYAVEHPEILTPLGSDYHGSQSHIYVPDDVCPFR
jgi:hypothetical protein